MLAVKGIRVQPRHRSSTSVVHLLLDESRTLCGRNPADLDVVATVDVDRLRPLDGCRACARTAEGWTPDAPGSRGYVGDLRITAEAAPGRVRRTGPLVHGTRTHRGSRMR